MYMIFTRYFCLLNLRAEGKHTKHNNKLEQVCKVVSNLSQKPLFALHVFLNIQLPVVIYKMDLQVSSGEKLNLLDLKFNLVFVEEHYGFTVQYTDNVGGEFRCGWGRVKTRCEPFLSILLFFGHFFAWAAFCTTVQNEQLNLP